MAAQPTVNELRGLRALARLVAGSEEGLKIVQRLMHL